LRIALIAGETKIVTFGIDPEKLAFQDVDIYFVAEPGIF
jgi:hypothetical protein